MTPYEWLRYLTFPVMPVHLQTVRRDIKKLVAQDPKKTNRLSVLDVGGRKSPYTIGVKADVTLLDVPQEAGAKSELNLGFTEDILKNHQKKRSNIKDLMVQDMTKSTLPDATYDAVVCVEVIEHVQDDEAFIRNISKIIKKDGWAYFTTPNGDYIKNVGPNKNPDHVRHYTKASLEESLNKYFGEVAVHYAVATGKYRVMGLKSFSKGNPLNIIRTIMGNIVNRMESLNVSHRSNNTAHLIAIVYKKSKK